MKKYILAVMCCLPLSLMAQTGFTVHGKIGVLDAPAKAYLRYYNDGKEVKDSVLLHKGQFTFKGQLSEPVQAELTLKHNAEPVSTSSREDQLSFYLENSDIALTSKDFVSHAVVKGSATNDDENRLRTLQLPYRRVADSLTKVYYSWTPAQRKDTTLAKTLRPIMQSNQAGYDNVNRKFIASHPNSYVSLLVFKELELGYSFNPDSAAIKFARFPESLKSSPTGKKLAAAIETGKKTNTGVMAMDFTEPDTTGKAVKLSDFRGQYVLVDFWASWCKPCRAENPNMLKAYNKYKSRNFTILGVSLDDSDGRRAWLGAVKKDGLPWTQVSELKGFKAKSAVLYGVTAIPTNFLVDPSGKIIARNLRGEELEKKLAALFPLSVVAAAQKSYTITGKITGLNGPAKVYLATLQGNGLRDTDSTTLKNGQFQFAGSITEPQEVLLSIRRFNTKAAPQRPDQLPLFLENSTISILATDSIKNAAVSGSVTDREHRDLEAITSPMIKTIINLQDEFGKKTKEGVLVYPLEVRKKAGESVEKMVAEIRNVKLMFAMSHPESFMGLYTFSGVLDQKFVPAEMESLFNQFSSELKSSELGKKTFKKIEIAKRAQTGTKATDFTQNDLNGKPFTLSSLRGKYVLVDFWASWCVPCRAENPNVVKAYNELKGKNFEIVGVSLDYPGGKAVWEEAVKKDGLPWIHVSDLKGWKNEVALMYGINSVPQNLLIDPQGIIIGKNLRGEALTEKLKQLIH